MDELGGLEITKSPNGRAIVLMSRKNVRLRDMDIVVRVNSDTYSVRVRGGSTENIVSLPILLLDENGDLIDDVEITRGWKF